MIANICFRCIFFVSYPTVLDFFSEGIVIVLGGNRLCRHFLAHGETKKSGKTVIFDQLQDLPGMVAQRFTTFFDVFQVKEIL